MQAIKKWIGKLLENIGRIVQHLIKVSKRTQFKTIGDRVSIGSRCQFTPETISIGNDVSIGIGCVMQSTHGEIIIGNHVMFGPYVRIHGGNHKIDVIGMYMKDVKKTEVDRDENVIIEDDVWVGDGVIILSGVTIGQGSVIGAGAVVTKDVPPYSIYTGVPSLKIRRRFTDEQIIEHERLIRETEVK